jgi:ABC-2 type transport system ATP-binding protein
MTHAIETDQLSCSFGHVEAVNRLSIQVPSGSVFALIGPNGAGKTTTIKLLMNLLRPSSGSATVLGMDTRRLGAAELCRVGYVSENQELPDWMTPQELLEYVRPLYPGWDDRLVRQLQSDLGLRMPAPLRQLSRGTRMKAALLASLAYRPELIVLDEPFTGLDPLVRDELVRALLEVPGSQDSWTVFLSSHDVDEVERLADSVGFIADGQLILAEPVASLLARFRLVEVIAPDGPAPSLPVRADWIPRGSAGRTLSFVHTSCDTPAAEAQVTATFRGAVVRISPMSLRDIFVVLARPRSDQEAR